MSRFSSIVIALLLIVSVRAAHASDPPQTQTDEPEDSPALVRAPGHIGLRYVLEGIEVHGNTTTLSRVVLRYVPFHAGDTLDVDDKELELTRFRLLGTGFFRDVRLSLRRGSGRGRVVLVVTVYERNTIVIDDLRLGVSAEANQSGQARPLTAYGGLDVAETNLAGTGITLGAAAALADGQLALRTRFFDPQFLRSDFSAEASLLYNSALDFFGNGAVAVDDPVHASSTNEDYAVLSYRRFGGMVGAGHDLGISTRIFFDYRLEGISATLPLAASQRRGNEVQPIDFQLIPGRSTLSTIRATLVHDTRDEPTLPTRGNYLWLLAEAGLLPFGSDYAYLKLHADYSHYWPLAWGHVVRFEATAGAIFGSAPLFEKFYVGDFSDLLPDRILGLNVDSRPAPNFLGTDIALVRYGEYAGRLMGEYRIPLYRGTRSVFGIDAFGSIGIYSVARATDFTAPPSGYSGLSLVPVDLTFNLGVNIETSAGSFSFGLANLIGFVPFLGGSP